MGGDKQGPVEGSGSHGPRRPRRYLLRRAMGLLVHRQGRTRLFDDGICTCGESEPRLMPGSKRSHVQVWGGDGIMKSAERGCRG